MPRTIDPTLESRPDADRQRIRACLLEVQRLRREHAAAILADGIFSSVLPSERDTVLDRLAETATARQRDDLEALLRIEKADPGSVSELDVESLALEIQWRAADQGFLLGLAVGCQLGPAALDDQG